jgi:hypothetical protein
LRQLIPLFDADSAGDVRNALFRLYGCGPCVCLLSKAGSLEPDGAGFAGVAFPAPA